MCRDAGGTGVGGAHRVADEGREESSGPARLRHDDGRVCRSVRRHDRHQRRPQNTGTQPFLISNCNFELKVGQVSAVAN